MNLSFIGWFIGNQQQDSICLFKCGVVSGYLVIQVSVTVYYNLSWLLHISKSKVQPNHQLLDGLPKIIGSVLDLNRILDFLNAVNLCTGNDDDKYRELIKARKGNFMDPSGLLKSVYTYLHVSTFRKEHGCLL